MRRLHFSLVFLVAVTASAAWAGIDNPFLQPVGERETTTANAGVAGRKASAGAVVFNPAGLELMENSSLSVSGSTYAYTTINATPFVNIDNTNINYDASGFDTIPSSVVSIWKGDPWTLAFSIVVPEAQRIENRLTLPTPNTRSTLVQLQSTQEMWIGPSVSRSFGDKLALGLSLFGVRTSTSQMVGIYTRFPAAPNLAGVSQSHVRSSIYSLTAVLGARYRVAPYLDLGLRIRAPGLLITGSGDGYNYLQTLDGGGGIVANEFEQKNVPARNSMPWDVSFGTGWRLSEHVRLMADVSLQAGVSYDPFPGSAFSDPQRFSTRPRLNVGVEADVSEDLELGAGFHFNPGTRDAADLGDGDVKQDFYVLTVGGGWNVDRVRSGLSLFYAWSDGYFRTINAPTQRSTFTMRSFGATLVFSYALGERTVTPTPLPSEPAPL